MGDYSFAEEGVHIFFIISGYLITHLLLTRIHSEQKENQPLKKFYLRRILRILPAFYTFHLVLLLLRSLGALDFSSQLLVKNLLFLTNFNFWGGTWLLGHIWSLSVEEQFYIIWPFLVYYLPLSRLKWLCVMVISLSPLVRVANYMYPDYANFWAGGFFQHADSIAFGALLSILAFTQKDKILAKWPNYTLLLVGVITVGIWWLKRELLLGIITVPLFYSFFSLLFTLLIWKSLDFKTSVFTGMLQLPLLGFIGKISFSLYLWQQLFLWPTEYQSADTWLFFQPRPFNILFAFLTAILSYYTVEKTFLKWKEKWNL